MEPSVQGQEAPQEVQEQPRESKTDQQVIDEAMKAAEAAGLDAEVHDTEEEGDTETEETVEAKTEEEKTEEKPEPKKEKTPEEVRLEQREEEIVRRDRALRQRYQQIAQQEHEVNRLRGVEKEHQELVQGLKSDPISGLKKVGLDILDILNSPGIHGQDEQKRDPQLESIAERLERLEREREQERQSRLETERKQGEQQAYQGMLGQIEGILKADPENYEAIFDQGRGAAIVFDALDRQYRSLVEQGYQPGLPDEEDIRKAAKHVESVLRKQEEERILRLQQSRRFSGRLKFGEPVTTEEAPATAPKAASPSPTTLTTKLSGDPASKRPAAMTEEERLQAALKIRGPGE